MAIAQTLLETIGNTPLIRLKRASDETGCTILGKAEFMNPGGSVKDRIGLAMIEAAEIHGSRASPPTIGRAGQHQQRGGAFYPQHTNAACRKNA